MQLVAQMPGVDQAMTAAAQRSWEAVVLVVVMVAAAGFFGWVFRRVMGESSDREIRLSNRVTHLEELIRTELMAALAPTVRLWDASWPRRMPSSGPRIG